jgi:curved DNA-binding protein CbpA
MATVDFYDVLGLTSDATNKEIRSAYRSMAKKYHPDKGGDPNVFELIVQAFNVLSDPDGRHKYDKAFQISKEAESDFFKLREGASSYMKSQEGMTKEEKEEAKNMAKLEFDKMWSDMNSKHDFKEYAQDDALSKQELSRRMAELNDLRKQEDIEDKPDDIFDGHLDPTKFNALFDKKYGKVGNAMSGTLIKRDGNPGAWVGGMDNGTYSSFDDYGKLYTEDDDLGLDGQNLSSLKDSKTAKLTKDDLDDLSGGVYYDNHNKLPTDWKAEMKKRLRERELESDKINDMGFTDFNDDPTMGGYGIFDQVGITSQHHLTWDDEGNTRDNYKRLLELRKKEEENDLSEELSEKDIEKALKKAIKKAEKKAKKKAAKKAAKEAKVKGLVDKMSSES